MWLLALWSSLMLALTRRKLREIAPYATAVLCGFAVVFGLMLVVYANPFAAGESGARRGHGAQPAPAPPEHDDPPADALLGLHAVGDPVRLRDRRADRPQLDAEWIRHTRRFALAAWFFLGVGILLGARWSYSELGWGGYWGWDAVENASLMPWLVGTAFIHSMMIQERRGMLKVWNVSLILATGTLASSARSSCAPGSSSRSTPSAPRPWAPRSSS